MGQGGQEGAGQNVLCVPEFSFYETLVPFDGFETVYDGRSAQYEIMFTVGGQALDPIAASGAAGYDPNLVRGVPCKIGQRVVLLLPVLPATTTKPSDYYRWNIIWRIRNLYDYRNAPGARYPYSLPKQSQGVADTSGPHPGARVVVPGVIQTVVYNQDEPTGILALVNHIRTELLESRATPNALPLLPNGEEGTIQQGVLDTPGGSSLYRSPVFAVHEVQAVGDELLLGLNRSTENNANWDFTNVDDALERWLVDFGLFAMVCRGVSP